MIFEWDEGKNIRNFKKHAVWFEEAKSVWADPNSVEFLDSEHSDKEERFIRIGHSSNMLFLLVIFCEFNAGNIVRIISARKATPKERKQYEEGI
ncbi:MAG: BrnT family toxin [Bacteriovoracaceae bacterium]|nr:BrnT family toxin [Bacteriovoracaceae bacterium]